MEPRLENILEAAIQEFIKTGEPVSSSSLYRRYDFGIKPAMIRNQLQELTELGFLDQPYHSAGRIPNDHGYEFFVERLLEDNFLDSPSLHVFENFFKRSAWPNLVQNLSEKFRLFGLADDLEHDEIYKEGINRLIENWDEPQEIKSIVRDLEHLDDRLDILNEVLENVSGIDVFIGRKSPITKSPELSVVAGKYRDADRAVTLVVIGPKRMNYQKIVGVFKNFQKVK